MNDSCCSFHFWLHFWCEVYQFTTSQTFFTYCHRMFLLFVQWLFALSNLDSVCFVTYLCVCVCVNCACIHNAVQTVSIVDYNDVSQQTLSKKGLTYCNMYFVTVPFLHSVFLVHWFLSYHGKSISYCILYSVSCLPKTHTRTILLAVFQFLFYCSFGRKQD